jgi:Fe-S oxidoreductase
VRDRINQESAPSEFEFLVDSLTPDAEEGAPPLGKRFFGNSGTVAKAGSTLAPLSNWVADTTVSRAVMERLLGVDRRRNLPQFERETLAEWFADRDTVVDDPRRWASLYPDHYTNHVQVQRGKAAVRTLEALGVDVVVPQVPSSGRAPLSQGMVATVRGHARRVSDGLEPYLDDGRDVVVVEPSDLAMFQREYERLLDETDHAGLADNSYEIMEYVYGLLDNGASKSSLANGNGERVAYHSHCQQRTLGLAEHTVAVFEDCGFDVVTSDVECCGMAGSFGYKSDHYEVSMAVGEELRDQFIDDDTADRAVVASGTSCLEQLDDLLERPTRHPVQLLSEHAGR